MTSGTAGVLISANLTTSMVTAGGSAGVFGLIGRREILSINKSWLRLQILCVHILCVLQVRALLAEWMICFDQVQY